MFLYRYIMMEQDWILIWVSILYYFGILSLINKHMVIDAKLFYHHQTYNCTDE